MSGTLEGRLRDLLGAGALERTRDGRPRALPPDVERLAALLALAGAEGWRVRIEGSGSWLPADAPADLVVGTRALDAVVRVDAADLVCTVQGGVPLDALHRRLARERMWLALDPPGRPTRTLGAIAATATGGPLRLGYGPVRDHVLGVTVVTGDGQVVKPGGRVVKNVAGYDLTKLCVGGFGAFGVLAELHLRLRALPPEDRTFVARGARDHLTSAARDLADAGLDAQALELVSPAAGAGADWVLAARLLGTAEGVAAEGARLGLGTDLAWEALPAERAGQFWALVQGAPLAGRVALRFGVLRDGLDDLLDTLDASLGEGIVTAGAASGQVRWSGEADGAQVAALRHALAPREVPVTLERAPRAVLAAAGHFGAYREGVGALVARLRQVFDPRGTLAVEADGAPHG
ncbi:MAG: FAD-binding oxidoreductase [Gemmatimonadales bacterium]|nr:FAD-binding oxidoreductase [Gemmatimonadales bacterium]